MHDARSRSSGASSPLHALLSDRGFVRLGLDGAFQGPDLYGGRTDVRARGLGDETALSERGITGPWLLGGPTRNASTCPRGSAAGGCVIYRPAADAHAW